jgi:hypothetical protein
MMGREDDMVFLLMGALLLAGGRSLPQRTFSPFAAILVFWDACGLAFQCRFLVDFIFTFILQWFKPSDVTAVLLLLLADICRPGPLWLEWFHGGS